MCDVYVNIYCVLILSLPTDLIRLNPKMVAKGFEVGDLVWAKMKGYSPWPGKIAESPANTKSPKAKKYQHYVFFFGTENYAWIPQDCIFLHNEKQLQKYGNSKKTGIFQAAVETIVKKSKDIAKYEQDESSDEQSNEDINVDKEQENNIAKHAGGHTSSAKKRSYYPLPTSKSSSAPNKIRKKVTVKKMSPTKKPARKRSISSDAESEAETDEYSSFSKYSKMEESYASLLANIPPNIEIDDVHVTPSTGVLARKYVECPETPGIDLMYESDILKQKKVEASRKKIGFLGLSRLGQGIVKNLAQAGHSLLIWNSTPEECQPFQENLNIPVADTPLDVVTASDITFCCLNDSDAAKALAFGNCGILKGIENCAGENKGYVEMTYMDSKVSQIIAEEIRMKGGRYLEAPATGSRADAIEGSLLVLCAGDKSLYDECESCLSAVSKKHMFVSAEVGTAAKLSTVNSAFMGTVYAAFAEGLQLVSQAGLKQENLLEIMKSGVLNNEELIGKGLSMITNDYATNIPLEHMQKTLQHGLLLGDEVGQPTPMFSSANEVYKHCKLMRYGDHDVSAIYECTKS